VYTAAGTTIIKDIPDYALAIDRGALSVREDYSKKKLGTKLDT
jgi:bifunctional UDP-N-acetylglucosamine pyrophosphorylase/glucosamine-1-phosphate N-acetyltransferase